MKNDFQLDYSIFPTMENINPTMLHKKINAWQISNSYRMYWQNAVR